jgi:hypothetical protein
MTEKAIASFKFSGLGESEGGLRNSRCTLMTALGFRLGVYLFVDEKLKGIGIERGFINSQR